MKACLILWIEGRDGEVSGCGGGGGEVSGCGVVVSAC